MDLEQRLAVVEMENALLRERVRRLEEALTGGFSAPVEWRLTRSEARVLSVLVFRKVATKAALMAALYRNDGKEEAQEKIVDVFICKIRRKLNPFGVQIRTHWGEGYSIEPALQARLRAAA